MESFRHEVLQEIDDPLLAALRDAALKRRERLVGQHPVAVEGDGTEFPRDFDSSGREQLRQQRLRGPECSTCFVSWMRAMRAVSGSVFRQQASAT